MNDAQTATGRTDWAGVAIFMAVACGWSLFFARAGIGLWPFSAQPPRLDDSVLVGFGPAVGGLVAQLMRRGRGFGPLAGNSRWLALLAVAAPALTLAAVGLKQPGWNPQLNGLIFGISLAVYCVGEELGWRGWLRQALAGETMHRRCLVTWVLWFGWHWTFLAGQLANPAFALQFAAGLALGSWGLEAAARRSGGTALPVAWHTAVKALAQPVQIAAMLALIAWANYASARKQPPVH